MLDISSINGKKVLFQDGGEREFDAIVFATDYRNITNNWLKVKISKLHSFSFNFFSFFDIVDYLHLDKKIINHLFLYKIINMFSMKMGCLKMISHTIGREKRTYIVLDYQGGDCLVCQ